MSLIKMICKRVTCVKDRRGPGPAWYRRIKGIDLDTKYIYAAGVVQLLGGDE